MCSDASPSGWSLTAKCGDKPVVKRIGRVKERVRFKLIPGVSARDQVLTRSGLLGFVDDLVGEKPAAGGRRLACDLPGKMCTGREREGWEAMSYKYIDLKEGAQPLNPVGGQQRERV